MRSKGREIVEKSITKENLKEILHGLLKEANLVAPTKAYNEVVFGDVDSLESIEFDYENCLNAPKDYVLLNDEHLFRYDLDKLNIKKDKAALKKTVIFGSRACDTNAIRLLDKFFERKYKDPLYFSKRKNIFIITLVCKNLGPNCFCTSTRTGPYLENGFDIQLLDLENGYYLEASSKDGRAFVKRFSDLMTNVDSDKRSQKDELLKMAVNSKKKDFDLDKVFENLDKLAPKDSLWVDLAQRCQSCGGCLLICPTCSCFYVVDKKFNEKEAARVRSLDACFYEGLTRMAGGYNPIRPEQVMMKRKFYHKLWQQRREFDMCGCTGCGRCNEICPGNVNWLSVIKRIEKKSP